MDNGCCDGADIDQEAEDDTVGYVLRKPIFQNDREDDALTATASLTPCYFISTKTFLFLYKGSRNRPDR